MRDAMGSVGRVAGAVKLEWIWEQWAKDANWFPPHS